MKKPFEVGDRIYGYCNGFFGRDCYTNKICVMVNDRYAIFEDIEDGIARVINFSPEEESKQFYDWTQEWKKEEKFDD